MGAHHEVCSQSPPTLTMMTDNMIGNTPALTCYCLRVTATWFGDDEDVMSSDGSSLGDSYIPAPVENTEVRAVPAMYLL